MARLIHSLCQFLLISMCLVAGVLSEDKKPTTPKPDSGASSSAPSSLYPDSLKITQLRHDTFESQVYNAKQIIWVVQFYEEWANNSQQFVPIFTNFSLSVAAWSSIVKVGAVNCYDVLNAPICATIRSLLPGNGYPLVRFFPPEYTAATAHLSKPLTDLTVEGLRHAILKDITARFTDKWQKRLLYVTNETFAALFTNSTTSDVYVVVEDRNMAINNTGLAVIMDVFYARPKVMVARMQSNIAASAFGLATDAGGLFKASKTSPRLSPVPAINSKSTVQEIVTEIQKNANAKPSDSTTTKDAAKVVDKTAAATPIEPDGLHMEDLESSMYSSLWGEIAGTLNTVNAAVVKNFTEYLATYIPWSDTTKQFFDNLVQKMKSSITARTAWKDTLDLLTVGDEDGYARPKENNWVGCKDSGAAAPRWVRGFPCGLWMTFHALTVNYYSHNHLVPKYDPMGALNVVRQYVNQVFTCKDCVKTFNDLAKQVEADVKTPPLDGVMLLWKIHNAINHKLRGEDIEDPPHPKYPFPSVKACATCRQVGDKDPNCQPKWNETEVLSYLIGFYGKDKVVPAKPDA